jgi:hypothetical protein
VQSDDAEHVSGLVAPFRPFAGALAWQLGLLVLPDQGEKAAEPPVLQHCRLGDAPKPVEGPIGHAPVLVADSSRPSGKSTTSTLLPIAAWANSDGSIMKRMLSYWSVRDYDSVRSARQVKASSSRSLDVMGRCISLSLNGALAKRAL